MKYCLLILFVFSCFNLFSQADKSFELYKKQFNKQLNNFKKDEKIKFEEFIKLEKEWNNLTKGYSIDKSSQKKAHKNIIKISNKKSKPYKKKAKPKKIYKPKHKKKTVAKTIKKTKSKIAISSPIKAKHRISSKYGYRIHPIYKRKKFHQGIDISCAKGSKIYSTIKGKIIKQGYSKSYGNYIIIQNKNVQVRFAHLLKIYTKPNQYIQRDKVIGLVGSTGLSTGPHLHYELIINGKTVNPVHYI